MQVTNRTLLDVTHVSIVFRRHPDQQRAGLRRAMHGKEMKTFSNLLSNDGHAYNHSACLVAPSCTSEQTQQHWCSYCEQIRVCMQPLNVLKMRTAAGEQGSWWVPTTRTGYLLELSNSNTCCSWATWCYEHCPGIWRASCAFSVDSTSNQSRVGMALINEWPSNVMIQISTGGKSPNSTNVL